MNLPSKEEIKAHLTARRKDFPRDLVASKIGVSLSTLNNSLAQKPMSDEMRYNIAKLTGMLPKTPSVEQIIPDNIISLKVPHEDYTQWEKAALKTQQTVSDWLINSGNENAAALLASEFGIINLPKSNSTPKKANIMAAAGSGIEAEVIDWEGDNDTVNVRIYGLSQEGLFSDGDVITMKHKRASRSPYMKKGLIYLVEFDGGMMVKEYNTRKPHKDEKGADYIDKGVVKVLLSSNPDFDEIIIDREIEWFAWYDKNLTQ